MWLLKLRRIIAFKLCFYFHKRVLKGCSLFLRDDWMFWKPVFSKSWSRIRLQSSISICSICKFLTARWYVVLCTLGQSLPLPLQRSPASRTFMPFYLPTLILHCVAPVVRLIKKIKNPGLIFKLCQNLTFLFIFWPLVDIKWKFQNFNIWVFLTK